MTFASIPLGGLRRATKALVPGATVNDVVLALVAAGLRSWAEFRGAALGSWRVKVPVSLHHHAEHPETANRYSFFCVGLPLSEPDPVVRLRRINEETTLRKGAGDALVLDTLLGDLARVAPPLRHVLDRLTVHPRAFALNVSNVIGPRNRPSVLGAPVRALYSIADVDQRHGLRVAVISMADELYFGLCAEPAIVGKLDPLVEGILAEAALLTDRSAAGQSRLCQVAIRTCGPWVKRVPWRWRTSSPLSSRRAPSAAAPREDVGCKVLESNALGTRLG